MHYNPRRIIGNAIALASRTLLVLALGLFTTRELIQNLGINDFGTLNVAISFVLLLSVVKGLFVGSTQRYLGIAIGGGEGLSPIQIFRLSLGLHFAIAAAAAPIMVTCAYLYIQNILVVDSTRAAAANFAIYAALATLLIEILIVPFDAALSASERFRFIAALSVTNAALRLFAAISLPFIGVDQLSLYASLTLLISLASSSLTLLYCRTNIPYCSLKPTLDKQLLLKMLSFSSWAFLGALSFSLKTSGFNLLLNYFFGTATNAARAVATQGQGIIASISGVVQTASRPQITALYGKGRFNEVERLILFSCKFSLLLSITLAITIFAFGEDLLSIWLDQVPPDTHLFLCLLTCVAVIRSPLSVFDAAIAASGNIRRFHIATSLSSIAGIAAITAIFGFDGPAWLGFASLIAIESINICVAANIAANQLSLQRAKLARYVLFRSTVACLAATMVAQAINTANIGNGALATTANVVLATVLNFFLVFLIGLTRAERKTVVQTGLSRLKGVLR